MHRRGSVCARVSRTARVLRRHSAWAWLPGRRDCSDARDRKLERQTSDWRNSPLASAETILADAALLDREVRGRSFARTARRSVHPRYRSFPTRSLRRRKRIRRTLRQKIGLVPEFRREVPVAQANSSSPSAAILRSAFAPRLCRPCRDRVLEGITLGYPPDATSACIGGISTSWPRREKSTAPEPTGRGSRGAQPLVFITWSRRDLALRQSN